MANHQVIEIAIRTRDIASTAFVQAGRAAADFRAKAQGAMSKDITPGALLGKALPWAASEIGLKAIGQAAA